MKKKSRGVISGDRGGQGVGPSLPIHLFGNVTFKNLRTCEPQCGGAPSCWKILETTLSNGKKIYIFVFHYSFIVKNVCNRGKNLCSPCISLRASRFGSAGHLHQQLANLWYIFSLFLSLYSEVNL